MKENVGTGDRMARSLIGPALMAVGYTKFGGEKGRTAGLAAMVLGTTLIESAITKVCPINAMLGIDTRQKRHPLARIMNALPKALSFHEKEEAFVEPMGKVSSEKTEHINWLRGMYAANIGFSLPFGIANLVAPKTMRRMLGIPSGDPMHYGVAEGAIPLAFGLAGVLGLYSPLKFSPVLGLQAAYKSAFLFGVALPRAVKGKVPSYAFPMVAIYGFFLAGNLIALRYPHLLPKPSAT